LWFVILFLVLQQIEGNLIYPKVVGNSVGLPSIWVLASVTIGGSLFGVAGMLVFIPLMSTLYSLLRDDVNRRNGVKGGRPRRDHGQNNTRNKTNTGNAAQQKQKKQGKQEENVKSQKAEPKGKAVKAENTDENSPEQIVARLVAEQEVKVKSELEQELKEKQAKPAKAKAQKPAQQKQQDNEAKAGAVKTEVAKTEATVADSLAGEEKKAPKKNNYYRNRNRNYHKKKANTPRT